MDYDKRSITVTGIYIYALGSLGLTNDRQYCSRKLHRLRRTKSTTSGNKTKTFKPPKNEKPLEVKVLSKEKQLLILLFRVERLWSYAMGLRKESLAEARKVFHERRCWKRAAFNAVKLTKMLEANNYHSESVKEAKVFYQGKTGWVSKLYVGLCGMDGC